VEEHPRLTIFPAAQVARCRRELPAADAAPWPRIDGCLTALFTARSGSTLLCRQLETLFEVGEMGEKLNFAKLKKRSAQTAVGARKEGWFGFKCGVAPLIGAELLGFFDAYLPQTVFVHLVRRDIVAQAVSYAKASQTGQWHAEMKPPGDATYDAGRIATALRSIAVQRDQLRRYVESTARPHIGLLYEDVANGGLTAARAAGEFLGLPRRRQENDGNLLRPVEKMSDAVNDEWKERFFQDIDPSLARLVDDYATAVDRQSSVWRRTLRDPPRQVQS
jgi:LPS sulfotransferase NodH